MIAIALVSIVFTQLDKVILSKMLTLEEFAGYMLAVAVSAGLYLIVVPTYNAMFPRFSGLVAANREAEIVQLYRLGTRLFAVALFPAAFVVAAFSYEILHVWTGDQVLAQRVASTVVRAQRRHGSPWHDVFPLRAAAGLRIAADCLDDEPCPSLRVCAACGAAEHRLTGRWAVRSRG